MSDDEPDWHHAAEVSQVSTDEALAMDIGDIEIALCKVGESIYAINNICTHEYACLSDGFIDGETIECPLHQAQFHIPTGEALSPPADVDVQTYPVRVVDGAVYIKIDP